MSIRALPAPRLHVQRTVNRLPAPVLRLPAFARDTAILLTVIAGYFLLRGVAPARVDAALDVSRRIITIERDLNLFWEPTIQDFSIRHHWMQEIANFVYAYLHFPVLAVVGAWLWWKDRHRFLFARNAMFVSMAIGLAFYYTVPAAPPRLLAMNGLDLGFTDTVFGGDTAVRYAQPSYILNEYAAIPSFHFGWIALACAMVWANTTNRIARAASLTLVVVMTWAIVASANHFFVDMALGGVVVFFSWKIAARMEAARLRMDPSYRGP